MRIRNRQARLILRFTAVACVAAGLSVPTLASTAAASGTTQNNGCLGVTGFSQFAVPITGSASPNPDTTGAPITLSGTSVAVGVDSTLIGAGVGAGLVSAADKLADLGVTANDGTANQSAGINQVVAAVGKVTLKISATNTAEGTQTANNSATASTTFYATADSTGGSVKVYTSVTNPPVLGGPNVPDPTRTGTLLTGNLNVSVPLSNTTWTPTGGNVTFSELNSAPANLTTPSPADQALAPLILLPKINGFINVPFHCWPGTVSGTTTTKLVPGPSNPIDTVVVSGVTTTTGNGQSTTTTTTTTTTTVPQPTTTTTTTPPQPTTTVPGVVLKTNTQTYVTNCKNSLSPKTVSNLTFKITATAPETATAGVNFLLSNQTWSVTTPGSLLDVGLGIGLINPGDTIPAQVAAAINASNTAQQTVTKTVNVKVGPIVVNPATGKAEDLTNTFAVPDMTFVSGGGVVNFSMGTTVFKLTLGASTPKPVSVVFTCTPQKSTVLLSTTIEGHATVTTVGSTEAAAGTTSATTSSTGGSLPFTGSGNVWLFLAMALIALDIGLLAISASRSARRRLQGMSR
jgi:hypothetical protein